MALRSIRLPEGAFLRIRTENGTAVGGDQSWLASSLSRRTCCGGVSMVNVLLSLTGRCGEVLSREEFVRAYYEVFPESRPLSGFVPFAKEYERRMKKMLRREKIPVRAQNLCALRASVGEAQALIAASLAEGRPCALQNWTGVEKPVRPWHWVTIIGIDIHEDPADSVLQVSSWGRIYSYPLAAAWRGKASLVTFRDL